MLKLGALLVVAEAVVVMVLRRRLLRRRRSVDWLQGLRLIEGTI